jgi:hypothetical protein
MVHIVAPGLAELDDLKDRGRAPPNVHAHIRLRHDAPLQVVLKLVMSAAGLRHDMRHKQALSNGQQVDQGKTKPTYPQRGPISAGKTLSSTKPKSGRRRRKASTACSSP